MKAETVEREEGLIKSSSMLLPAMSGILAAIRRIISRRVSTKVLTEVHFCRVSFGIPCTFNLHDYM